MDASFRPHESALRDFLFQLMPAFFDEPRVEAVWAEGEPDGARAALRTPLDLHLATPEPYFDAIVRELPEILGRVVSVKKSESRPADFEGRTLSIETAAGQRLDVTVERAALVGKRARKAILPQMDRSGLLRYSVDLSAGKKKA